METIKKHTNEKVSDRNLQKWNRKSGKQVNGDRVAVVGGGGGWWVVVGGWLYLCAGTKC